MIPWFYLNIPKRFFAWIYIANLLWMLLSCSEFYGQPKGLNSTDTFILLWGKKAEPILTRTPIIFIKKDWRGVVDAIYLRRGHNSKVLYTQFHFISQSQALYFIDFGFIFCFTVIPLAGRARPTIIQLQIQTEIHVLIMDLS